MMGIKEKRIPRNVSEAALRFISALDKVENDWLSNQKMKSGLKLKNHLSMDLKTDNYITYWFHKFPIKFN